MAVSTGDELWVVEYSDLSAAKDMYPWHITTKDVSDRKGPSFLNWRVVFEGSEKEAWDYLHAKAD